MDLAGDRANAFNMGGSESKRAHIVAARSGK